MAIAMLQALSEHSLQICSFNLLMWVAGASIVLPVTIPGSGGLQHTSYVALG